MGFQAAQIVHGAGESIRSPLPPETSAIVLEVRDESHLLTIAKQLQLHGVPHVLIREIDAPFTGQCTAIGVVPLTDRSKVKKIFSSLPLLGKMKTDKDE